MVWLIRRLTASVTIRQPRGSCIFCTMGVNTGHVVHSSVQSLDIRSIYKIYKKKNNSAQKDTLSVTTFTSLHVTAFCSS